MDPRVSRERRDRSRSTLLRFQDNVRKKLIESTKLCQRVTAQLEQPKPDDNRPNLRKQLSGWLQLHRDRLAEEEELDKRLIDQLRAIGCPDNSLRSKRQLVTRLVEQLETYDKRVADTLSKEIIAAGLGVAFMRYSDASRFSYYHTLEMGLLPNATRDAIAATALVPDWSGTIGWISREAWLSIREKQKGPAAKWEFLWSCFHDPKGRVAMEDLVLGNRSFAGIPVLELDDDAGIPRLMGILFCFLPVDGVFLNDDGEAPIRDVEEALKIEWNLRQEGLLHSLEVEAFANLYRNSQRSSLADLHRDTGEDDQSRRIRWLKQTLLADGASDPSDPLGLQLVMDMEQDVSSNRDTQAAKCQFLFREETFVREVFRRLQLSCRCPTRWAPRFAWDMQAIHDFVHEQTTVEACFPIWRVDTAARLDAGNTDTEAQAFYPKTKNFAFQQFVNGINQIQAETPLTRNDKRIGDIYGRLPDATNEWTSGLDFDDNDPFRLNRVLRHHSPPHRMVDLVLPLVFDRKCVGYLRFKCWSEQPVHKLDAKSKGLFHSFYQLLSNDFSELRKAISELLWSFEENCDKVSDDLPGLKTWLDMRLAFCDAIAKGLCCGLGRNDDAIDSGQRELVLVASAAKIESEAAGAAPSEHSQHVRLSKDELARFAALISTCHDRLDPFLKTAKERDLPDVVLVSVWLARERPTIIGAGKEPSSSNGKESDKWVCDFLSVDDEGIDHLHKLFIDDPALMQFVRMFLRWSRQRDLTTIDLRWRNADVCGYYEDNKEVRLPVGFVTRPVYIAERPADKSDRGLCRCSSVQFRTRRIAVDDRQIDVSQTVFRRYENDSGLRIDWQWTRSPIPVAVAYAPKMVNASLFHGDNDSGSYHISITDTAQELLRNTSRNQGELIPLTRLLQGDTHGCGASHIPNIVQRVNDILHFLPNEEHEASALCRLASAVVGNNRYSILVHGQIPKWSGERPMVARLRDDAVTGALGDVALLMQTSVVKLARDHRMQIRFLAHQLDNDLGTTDTYLENVVSAVERDDHNETLSRTAVLKDKFRNLRCLLRCLTRSGTDVKEFRFDVVTLLDQVVKWKSAGLKVRYEKSIPSGLATSELTLSLDITRDVFLVFNNLVNNALSALPDYATTPNRYLKMSVFKERREGEDTLVLSLTNSARKPIEERFIRFVENEDPLSELVPVSRDFQGTQREHRGLWTIRRLLFVHNLGRLRFDNSEPPGEVTAEMAIPMSSFSRG